MWKLAALLFSVAQFMTPLTCWSSQAPVVKNVLVVHEGSQDQPSNILINTQIHEVFKADATVDEEVFEEYLDEGRLGRDTDAVADGLHRKYAAKVDLIISVGMSPFRLLLNHGAAMFPGVPVVSMLVSERAIAHTKLPPNMTAVTGHAGYVASVELALRLHPDLRRVYVVSGSSDLDHYAVDNFKQDMRKFAGPIEFTYLADLTLEELLSRVSHLPRHSVIFYLVITRDAAGHPYTAAEICSVISSAANAPVYSAFQTYLGKGVVGGSINDLAKHSRQAAQLGLEILKGASVKDLPPSPGSTSEMTVDWRQLQRWQIPETRLPKETIVLFAEPSTWRRYRRYILGTIAVLLIQAVLIAALLAQVRKRAAAERAVKRRLDFETLISETSAPFINLPQEQTGAQIEHGLDRVRSFLNVDRITLYDRLEPRADFRALHYAAAGNAGPPTFPFLGKQFPWASRHVLGGQALLLERIDELPSEAAAERELSNTGIKSLAAIPVRSAGSVLGLLVLVSLTKHRGWPRELVRQLQILGDIFYQAVQWQRAEAAARESEQRFALVADTAPMLVWMSGPDKLCTYFNRGWLAFTGRTMEQEVGDGWTTGVHSDDVQKCLESYVEAFDARQKFKLEYRLRRADGEYRWIMDVGVPRYSSTGDFCGYIGSCIDITDLKRSQQELEELSGRLIHAQEEERKRVARELHDNFGQKLVVLSMDLAQHLSGRESSQARENCLRNLSEQLKEVSRAMNVTAHQLHSSHLEVLGLVSALQGLCVEFSRQYGIEVVFVQNHTPEHPSSDVSLCLFRVVQEGLQNVAKHSGSRTCRVELKGTQDGIHLSISDSGIGFDTARLKLKPGLGFISMRERLRLVGGQLTVESTPSVGTVLEIHVPLASMSTAA